MCPCADPSAGMGGKGKRGAKGAGVGKRKRGGGGEGRGKGKAWITRHGDMPMAAEGEDVGGEDSEPQEFDTSEVSGQLCF